MQLYGHYFRFSLFSFLYFLGMIMSHNIFFFQYRKQCSLTYYHICLLQLLYSYNLSSSLLYWLMFHSSLTNPKSNFKFSPHFFQKRATIVALIIIISFIYFSTSFILFITLLCELSNSCIYILLVVSTLPCPNILLISYRVNPTYNSFYGHKNVYRISTKVTFNKLIELINLNI